MLHALLDLAMPRLCVACRAPHRQALCAQCRPDEAPLLSAGAGFPVAAAGGYDGPLRTALLAYKERDRRDLAPVLGSILADAVRALDPGTNVALVPVPSSRRARRTRGGDHMLRLARVVARSTGLPVRTPLRLTRVVRDSAGLNAATRLANVCGAMTAVVPDRPTAVILLDDIATTGATLTEAARALVDAGWQVAGAAVIAASVKRAGRDRWRDPVHRSSVGMT